MFCPSCDGARDRFFHDALAPVRAIRHLTEWVTEDLEDAVKPIPAEVQQNLSDMQDQANRLDCLLRRTALWLDLDRTPVTGTCRVAIAMQAALATPATGPQIHATGDADLPMPSNLLELLFKEAFDNIIRHGSGTGGVRCSTGKNGVELIIHDRKVQSLKTHPLQMVPPFQHSATTGRPGLGIPIMAEVARISRATLEMSRETGVCLKFHWQNWEAPA